MDTQTAPLPAPHDPAATLDSGMVRLGAGMRRQAPVQAHDAVEVAAASVADTGRIRLGAGMRVPTRRHG